jgi:hypothetical protein
MINTVNSTDWSGWILINLITISFLLSFPCRSYFFFLFFFFFLWWWHSILREKWIWIIYEEPAQLTPIDINIIYINKKIKKWKLHHDNNRQPTKKKRAQRLTGQYISRYIARSKIWLLRKLLIAPKTGGVARLVLC